MSQRTAVRVRIGLACLAMLIACVSGSLRAADNPLPGTGPLTEERPLDEVMLAGLQRFSLRELAAARERRSRNWSRDFSSLPGPAESIEANRQRFRAAIGVVDVRVTSGPAPELRFELSSTLDWSSVIARAGRVTVHAVRWPVLEGVTAEGLLLVPDVPRAGVVALPDADWTPEMFCGLTPGLPESVTFVRRLAAAGCIVAVPMLISRADQLSGHPHVAYTNQPHREFLYRQAFEVGRHIIGYEVQKVLAAVDLLEQWHARDAQRSKEPFPIGVAGVGEGGLIALYAAAVDPRLRSTLVCGYFQEREGVWQEPIYRNVWGLLTEFGDAELAARIAPRRLIIEASGAVEVAGPPALREGRRLSAAQGRIVNNTLNSVKAEFERATAIGRSLGMRQDLHLAVSGPAGTGPAGTDVALQAFAKGLDLKLDEQTAAWQDQERMADPARAQPQAAAREKRQFQELQEHVQTLLRRSPLVRNAKWVQPPGTLADWEEPRKRLRDWVHDEVIGRMATGRMPANPRTRLVRETAIFIAYEVMLDVQEDVIASGLLLLPKNVGENEKRPLIVCQHGLEGTPLDTMSHEESAFRYYKAFAETLVNRGFLVYAPQNPYRGGERFRSLQRKLNPLMLSLFSCMIAQHEQTLDWLATLPHVDASRIAFYGLSYGGKTAVRVPPFVDRYCLSICSGDFTDWVKAVATNEDRYGYIFTTEYEVPEWNMAHVASHAELAMLMAPRPFMVEAGHRDSGQPTELVAGEFGKVRRHYDQLGLADRAELEFFDGPHTIHGQGTFRFLHRHLKWPEPRYGPEKE